MHGAAVTPRRPGAAETLAPGPRRRSAAAGASRIMTLTVIVAALAGTVLMLSGSVPTVHGVIFAEPLATPLPPAVARAQVPQPAPGPPPTHSAPVQATAVHQPGLRASSIRIPVLGVTAAIGRTTLHDGLLSPPSDPAEVGLWPGSSSLEAAGGETTVVGHVDWAGKPDFAFERISSLRPGDLVYTTDRHDAQSVWEITGVTARPETDGVDPGAFTASRGQRSLVLVTCGNLVDDSTSADQYNVYAYAILASRGGEGRP